MRTWYLCLGCAAHYLPPESMTYPGRPGLVASPVHCGLGQCRAAAREIVARSGLPAALFEAMALRAAQAADAAGDPARPVRRARGRRSASGPRSARTRLG
ncbi:hypothetical protein ACIQ9E_16155 [Streptomyces sp. NPDC094448]|uniref:hypothetical protein n=1 Tax=Streptomyces sp. NPDC094448 TaxID=3366063 RepID=UPI0038007D75